jgi:hypothetical protein
MKINSNEFLDTLTHQAKDIGEQINSFNTLSFDQLNWKPSAKAWSVGQCIDHLITFNNQYLDRFEKAIDEAKAAGWHGNGHFHFGWMGPVFVNRIGPYSSSKVKTAPVFEPAASNVQRSVIHDFQDNQRRYISILEEAKGIDLNKPKIFSPVSGIVYFRLGNALHIITSHEARHLNQMRRVMASPGFPS